MIENVKCPECAGPMTSRKNTRTGQRFWGCKDYPRCTGTRDTDGDAPGERESETRLPSERMRDQDRRRW